MINPDTCLKLFLEREPENVALKILCGELDINPNSWYDNSPPEDVIVGVLKNKKTPKELYDKVIEACKEVGNEFADYVFNREDGESKELKFKALERLCGVIELSKPIELEDLTRSTLLPLALKNRKDNFWKNYCYSILCSVSRYPHEEDKQMYEELLQEQDFAALSFNKLIELNPNNPRLKEHLKYLWLKHFNEEGVCDASFLAGSYLKKTSPEHLKDVLISIKKDDIRAYDKLLNELKERNSQRKKGNLYEELLSIAESIN